MCRDNGGKVRPLVADLAGGKQSLSGNLKRGRHRAGSERVVRITRNLYRYVKPAFHAVKQEIGEGGSVGSCYQIPAACPQRMAME